MAAAAIGTATGCPPSSTPRSVRSSRYFTITGVYSDSPHSAALPLVIAREPGTTTASSGTRSGLVSRRAIDFARHGVEQRRRSRQNHAGAQHGARAHLRAFVDAAVSADQHVVLDDHGRGVDRLQHAADLRGGADVYALADLRAGAHQRVRVDHRAFVDVGADVDEHRRHADHGRRDVGSAAHRRASGNHAHLLAGGEVPRSDRCPCRRTRARAGRRSPPACRCGSPAECPASPRRWSASGRRSSRPRESVPAVRASRKRTKVSAAVGSFDRLRAHAHKGARFPVGVRAWRAV